MIYYICTKLLVIQAVAAAPAEAVCKVDILLPLRLPC